MKRETEKAKATRKNNKQAISLIMLVITIVVMIILAGAIILTLNNSGIIEKASQAVERTNEATVKELATLGWAEAYAEYGADKEKLAEGVENALTKNNIDLEDYTIIVTTSGVEISEGWLQNGLTVVKGSQVLGIGDAIAYDETKGGTETVEKDVTWKVLGAENGELLIVSADSIVTSAYKLGSPKYEGDIALAQNDYIYGVTKLNTICEAYGKGEGAVSVRSIKVEDVNRVTGYDPETSAYGKETLEEYGNKVTYMWNGSSEPYCTTSNKLERTLTGDHGGKFIYYDGEKFVTSTNTGATAESPVTITTLENNAYNYYGTTLTSSSNGEKIGLSADSKAYKMLFRDSGDTKDDNYWLASRNITTDYIYARFGIRYVYGGKVCIGILVYSAGLTYSTECGVRAVVSLGSDIKLSGNSTNGWTF